MKTRIKALVSVLLMCCLLACFASALSSTKEVMGYKNKNYNLSIQGDDSKMTAYGTSSTCYTSTRNTSSANLYVTVEISGRYGVSWRQISSSSKTDDCLAYNEVVASPSYTRSTSDYNYKYVHTSTAYNYQNHSIIEDKLIYRVDQDS